MTKRYNIAIASIKTYQGTLYRKTSAIDDIIKIAKKQEDYNTAEHIQRKFRII